MKRITLFIIFILVCFYQSSAQDLIKYQKAYEYILNDSTLLNDSFEDHLQNWDKSEICVSPKIQHIGMLPIINKVVEYEYSPINYNAKKKVIDCLFSNDVENFEPYMVKSLLDFNNSNMPCKLKIFYSNIKENKLLCKVVICNDCSDSPNESFKKSVLFVMYMIYFENDEISHVLNTIGYQ